MTKSSVIIGGTSGIGLETARYLKDHDYEVYVGARSRLADEPAIESETIDVTDEQSIKKFFSAIQLNKIDSLIYSAGITTGKKDIQQFDIEEYQNVQNVNLLGAILVLKYAYPFLKTARGKVVVVSSVASRTYSKFSGIEYTVSKSGLSGLVKQLAVEWAPDGVLINTVFPSMVETPMLRENVEESVLVDLEKEIPLGRIARPSDVAAAIEFLVSEKNTYITGTGIDINGGQYLTG